MTHAIYFQDIEYIHIKLTTYLNTPLTMNITETNLSLLLGGQLGKNRNQNKNK